MKKKRKFLSWVLAFCLTLICFSIADFTVSAATENTTVFSGESYRFQNVGSGKYLNLKGGKDVNGTNINQFTGDNSITQDFIIRWIASENCYKIYSACCNKGTERMLSVDLSGTSVAANSNVHLWQESTTKAQGLQIVSAGTAGQYYIQPINNTTLYLTANGDNSGSANTGANATGNVVMKSAQSNANYQKWKLILKNDVFSEGTFFIRNKYSDLVLGNASNYAMQQTKSGADRQQWQFIKRTNGNYIIKSATTDHYMTTRVELDSDGVTNLILIYLVRDAASATEFEITTAGDRCYYIRPITYASKVMALRTNTADTGVKTYVSNKNVTYDRQKWYLERVPTDDYADMDWEYVFSHSYTTHYRYLTQTFWEPIPLEDDEFDYHAGIDIVRYEGIIDGATILSPTNGRVVLSVPDGVTGGEGGNHIVIETNSIDPFSGKKLRVGFYHLKEAPNWFADQSIFTRNVVGKVGTTGMSSAPHLHLFVTSDGTNNSGTSPREKLVDPTLLFPHVEFLYHD